MLRRPSKGKTLGVQCSDDRRRVKPSGFSAPTTVEGQNPRGSVLRRASEGKTLGVQCSDDRRRAKPSGFSAPTSVEGQNPQGSVLRRPSKGKTLRVQCSDDRRRAESSGVQACYRDFRRKRIRARFLSRRWKANSRRSAPCTCKVRSISVESMSFGHSVSSSTTAARSSFSFGRLISRNGFGSPAK